MRELLVEKMNRFYGRHIEREMGKVMQRLSSWQMKNLLHVVDFTPHFILIHRLVEKYDTLTNNILSFHIDFPSIRDSIERIPQQNEEEALMRRIMEARLSYIMFEMYNLEGRNLRSFFQGVPEYLRLMVQSTIRPPSSPPYSPRPYGGNYEIQCDVVSCAPNVDENTTTDCCICQEKKECVQKVVFNCNHYYCYDCVYNFIKVVHHGPTCPLCRTSVLTMTFCQEELQLSMLDLLEKKRNEIT